MQKVRIILATEPFKSPSLFSYKIIYNNFFFQGFHIWDYAAPSLIVRNGDLTWQNICFQKKVLKPAFFEPVYSSLLTDVAPFSPWLVPYDAGN